MVCKKLLSIIFIFSSILLVINATKESFIIEPKKKRTAQRPRDLKQDIGQLLAKLLNQTSYEIEVRAKVSQEILKRLEELIDEDKNSYLNKTSSKELQECKKKLEKLEDQWKNNIEELENSLKFFKDGCVLKNMVDLDKK